MAISSELAERVLQIEVSHGETDLGHKILRNVNFVDVKEEAIKEDLHEIGVTLSDLQKHSVQGVYVRNTNQLKEE